LSTTVRAIAPLLVFAPAGVLVLACARGMGETRYAEIFHGLRPVLVTFGVIALWLTDALSVGAVLGLTYGADALVVVAFLLHVRPSLHGLPLQLHRLRKTNREHGIPVYVAQLTDQAALQMPLLMIPLYRGTAEVGFYALATRISQLISLPSQNLNFAYIRRCWPAACRYTGFLFSVTGRLPRLSGCRWVTSLSPWCCC